MIKGKRYQFFSLDANYHTVHCGAHEAPRMSKKVAIRSHRKWLRWRADYLASNPGNYHLRTDRRRVVWVGITELSDKDAMKKIVWFRVS